MPRLLPNGSANRVTLPPERTMLPDDDIRAAC
ncbi:hypothetical protein D893_02728, partial [Thioalkalivibrio sp. ALE21]